MGERARAERFGEHRHRVAIERRCGGGLPGLEQRAGQALLGARDHHVARLVEPPRQRERTPLRLDRALALAAVLGEDRDRGVDLHRGVRGGDAVDLDQRQRGPVLAGLEQALVVAVQPDQRRRGVGGALDVAVAAVDQVRLLGRGHRRWPVGAVPGQRGLEVQRRGGEARIGQAIGVGAEAGHVALDHRPALQGDRGRDRVGAGAHRGELGGARGRARRDDAPAQVVGVAAHRRRLQARDQVVAAGDRLGVGVGQRVDERAERGAVFVEARRRQAAELGRPGVLAHRPARGLAPAAPRRRRLVEGGGGVLGGGRGTVETGGAEPGEERVAPVGGPGRAERGGGLLIARRRRRRRRGRGPAIASHHHREADRADRQRRQRRRRDPPQPRRRRPGQRRDQLGHRREPRRRISREAARDHPGQPVRTRRQRRRPALDRREQLDGGVGLERPTARHRLVERHAQGEHIAARVGRLAAELLGRHVRRRALDVGRRGRRRAGRAHRPADRCARDPEIRDADPTIVADQDVAGLDVAMDDPRRVRRAQAARRRRERLDDRHPRRPGREPRSERSPAHELHRQEHAAVALADIEHWHHVRMRELRHRPRLARQPLLIRLAEESLVQQLQRHLAIQHTIVRRPHHAHPSHPELLDQDIPLRLAHPPSLWRRRTRRPRHRRRVVSHPLDGDTAGVEGAITTIGRAHVTGRGHFSRVAVPQKRRAAGHGSPGRSLE